MIGRHCNVLPACNWIPGNGPVGCGCICPDCLEARAVQEAARGRGRAKNTSSALALLQAAAMADPTPITLEDINAATQKLRDAPVPNFQDIYGVGARESAPDALRVNVEVCPQARDQGNVTPKNMTAQEVGACVTALILTGQVVELHITRENFRVMVNVPSDAPYPVLENIRDELVAVRRATMEALAQGAEKRSGL